MKDLQSIHEIEIVRLASDGTGVGYIDGKTTFVTGMLPGEKGKVKLVESKSTYQRAEPIEISHPSSERVSPRCPVFTQCGGCSLQHMNYEHTLEWKRKWVTDTLQRIGGIQDIEVEPVIGMTKPWRYRNKAVLHRDAQGRFGYHREKTNEVVSFTDCLLLSTSMNKKIKKLQEGMGSCCSGITTATFRQSNRGKALVLLDGNVKNTGELEKKIKALRQEPEFSPSVCSVSIPKGNVDYWGTGPQFLNEHIDDIRFRVSPRAFLQVNPEQTAKLYSLVLNFAQLTGKEELWDLYCGIGTITLVLATRCKKVLGIEENPHAVKDAIENAKDNDITNVQFIQGKVEDKLKAVSHIPDIVVTDPPRAGMNPLVIEKLLEIKPKKIIYVSCNPATLARDLKALTTDDGKEEGAYSIQKVQPVDMFPWTSHVESIVLMTNSGLKGK